MKQITLIYTGIIFISFLFLAGCSDEKEVVYVDSNTGKVIQSKPKFRTVTPEVVCDARGYAFYRTESYGNVDYYSLTPILKNYSYGAYQVKCEDL